MTSRCLGPGATDRSSLISLCWICVRAVGMVGEGVVRGEERKLHRGGREGEREHSCIVTLLFSFVSWNLLFYQIKTGKISEKCQSISN